jgi:hypothetical protein
MKNVLKVVLITIGFITALLIVTNPGMQRFKDFGNENTGDEQRLTNYFLFSVYQRGEDSYEYGKFYSHNTVKYVGILLNFYQLN